MRPTRRTIPLLFALALSAGLGAGCTNAVAREGVSATAVPPVTATAAPVTTPESSTTSVPGQVDPAATSTTVPVDPRVAVDRAAGVRSTVIPPRASGQLRAVVGNSVSPNPAAPLRRTVSFEVEDGLDVDGAAFAAFALSVLNDRRSWAHDGYSFEQVPQGGQIHIVLASPHTSEDMCRPLDTLGTMSCSQGNRVTLTWFRWVQGQEEFRGDVTTYRQYLINHEVGHTLGHGHVNCPGAGAVAPVMMQQTLGLKGCLPGPWAYPAG